MKLSKYLVLAVLVSTVGFLLARETAAQGRVDRILLNEANRITKDDFPIFAETPNGVRVYAVNHPSSKVLNAIDEGFAELFRIARKFNYKNRLNYSDYTVFIARADRTKDSRKAYSPDIAVAANQYAGSVYDQGGFVYAAGMVMAYNPCAFIIAEHTRDFQRVSNVVRFEGEHLVLYHNDRRLYNQTADHSKGGGHPILQ